MMNRSRSSVLVVLVATVIAAAGLGACAGGESGGSVTILGSWTGAEEQRFRQALDAFTEKTGTEVTYRGTRALGQVLLGDVQKGTPPDVAVLPSPGELVRYAGRGDLKPLGEVVGAEWETQYSPQWKRLAMAGMDELYAVPVQVNLKSIVWYNPNRLSRPAPSNWNELMTLSKSVVGSPWCMGMGAAATSGWPGTDWIEDILLQRSGVDVYQRWVAGRLPWTSPQVREAWRAWGEVVTGQGQIRGGAAAAMLTEFSDAARPMFANPPGCYLEHQASFMAGVYRGYGGPMPGEDFAFFPFPGGDTPTDPSKRSWEVSADMAGMFNDTPQARALIRFLASEEAQRIWARGNAFSANTKVRPEAYADEPSRQIAGHLLGPGTLCFDASDLMPATMRNAFYRAVLEYLGTPGRLDAILGDLDSVRIGLAEGLWLKGACGQ